MSNTNDYEKIQLSKDDLRYIYGQLMSSITSKLDLHLPTSNNDPLKVKVAGLLEDFLLDTFEFAKLAMIVDGQDMSVKESYQSITDIMSFQPKEMIEPFDFELNQQLREVLETFEKETVQVTKLRKELPHRGKQVYAELIKKTDQEVSEILAQIDSESVAEGENTENTVLRDIPLIDRIDQVVKDYETSLQTLNQLKKTVPQQKAELDRLQGTVRLLEDVHKRQIQ